MKNELNLVAPFNTTSYGYVSCYVLSELKKLGCDIHSSPIHNVVAEQKFGPAISESINTPFFYNAPNLKVWHQHSLMSPVGRGPTFAFTFFELDTFNDKERHSLGFPDHLFVCSEWARQVVLNNTSRKAENTHVVPLGIDPDIFKPYKSPIKDKTVFLNCGKWELRKGHDILIEAFCRAFNSDDEVELLMMPHNFFLSEEQTAEWRNYYTKNALGGKVRVLERQNTQEEVYNIMRQAHCGVFPSRAEGWNLELLEMMAIGKHVIATNNTAHTEYCDNENCLLIETPESEPAFDGVFFSGNGNWAALGEHQVNKLAEHMKEVHLKRKKGELGVNVAGIATGESYTWVNTAKKIHGLIYGS